MNFQQHMSPSEIPWYLWLVIAALLLSQGLWVYRDAEARGENKWAWGLFGLMNFPSSGLIYWFVTRRVWERFWKR